MLPQFSQAHSPCKLLHRDSVVQEGFCIVKIGIVSAVAGDQVVGVYIHAEMVNQIALGPPGHRGLDGKQTMLHQDRDPVQNGVIGAVQIQNVQILRVQCIAVGKSVSERGHGPLLCQIFTFRAVEA